MTKSFVHFDTIPSDMMDVIEEDLNINFDNQMHTSGLMGGVTNLKKRSSQNAWIPTTHWLGGLMWHYYKRANDEFFKYNLTCIDGESMQYTHYGLNEHYDWHIDEGLTNLYRPVAGANRNDERKVQDFVNERTEQVRKLSAIVQLAHSDDYEGGSTQLRDIDNSLYTIPRERGTIVFFDSRLQHRAKAIRRGLRKSLICWAIGPRWK